MNPFVLLEEWSGLSETYGSTATEKALNPFLPVYDPEYSMACFFVFSGGVRSTVPQTLDHSCRLGRQGLADLDAGEVHGEDSLALWLD